jgi:uncharacterized protein (DUF488 family)
MSTIFTIGHSNLSIGDFCGLLHDRDVRCLADIRSVPYSRYCPQFNQKALAGSLEAARIGYSFLGDVLGGRIREADCYLGRAIPRVKAGYAEYLDYGAICSKDWFNSGIAALLELARGDACAIMCSEEDPGRCHRELIVGRRLRELGASVVHIRSKDGDAGQIGLFDGWRAE